LKAKYKDEPFIIDAESGSIESDMNNWKKK
jgi:hypothetical protein